MSANRHTASAFGSNKTMLVGQLGDEVEIKFGTDGLAMGRVGLATSEKTKRGTQTEWHNLVLYGKQAETCKRYAGKGSRIYIIGKIHYASWEYQGKKYFRTEIHVQQMLLLDRRGIPGAMAAALRTLIAKLNNPALSQEVDAIINGSFGSTDPSDEDDGNSMSDGYEDAPLDMEEQ